MTSGELALGMMLVCVLVLLVLMSWRLQAVQDDTKTIRAGLGLADRLQAAGILRHAVRVIEDEWGPDPDFEEWLKLADRLDGTVGP
jgi:hypothetical protein